jgi:hypothetical protein
MCYLLCSTAPSCVHIPLGVWLHDLLVLFILFIVDRSLAIRYPQLRILLSVCNSHSLRTCGLGRIRRLNSLKLQMYMICSNV